MVWTPLKNMSQNGNFPCNRGENKKCLSCHHLEKKRSTLRARYCNCCRVVTLPSFNAATSCFVAMAFAMRDAAIVVIFGQLQKAFWPNRSALNSWKFQPYLSYCWWLKLKSCTMIYRVLYTSWWFYRISEPSTVIKRRVYWSTWILLVQLLGSFVTWDRGW